MTPTYQSIDQRANPFYRSLEENGIPLDPASLESLLQAKQANLNEIKQKLSKEFGFIPNPNKGEDWQKIADQYQIQLPRSSRGPKTDAWTVKQFKDQIPALLDLQEAKKVRRTISVLDSLKKKANARFKTEGVHSLRPTYKHDETLGRTHAGGEANPMNWTPEIRGLVSAPGYYIAEADYKAIELRVLTKLSKDPLLAKDLKGDIHTEVAKTIFKTDNPTKGQRDAAKIVTFATIYDGGPPTVAGPINDARKAWAIANGKDPDRIQRMSWDEAEELQNAWKERYPVAAEYIDHLGQTKDTAISYHGRTKPLPQPVSDDPEIRLKEEAARRRLAINSPIQNTGGDLAKLGFATVYEDPRIHQLGIKILTTVHDSIILQVPEKVDKGLLTRILREDMENIDPEFELPIEIEFGKSWGETKEWTQP